jgi:hypothetical protein
MVGHDGDLPGYQCFMGRREDDGLIVVVLTNLHGWSVKATPANEIAEKILLKFPLAKSGRGDP